MNHLKLDGREFAEADSHHARTRVAAWIDDYNRDRKHSCGTRSPLDHEAVLRSGKPPDRTAA